MMQNDDQSRLGTSEDGEDMTQIQNGINRKFILFKISIHTDDPSKTNSLFQGNGIYCVLPL